MDANRLPETCFVLVDRPTEAPLAVVLTADDAAALRNVMPKGAEVEAHEVPLVVFKPRPPRPVQTFRKGGTIHPTGGINITPPPPDNSAAVALAVAEAHEQRRGMRG